MMYVLHHFGFLVETFLEPKTKVLVSHQFALRTLSPMSCRMVCKRQDAASASMPPADQEIQYVF